MISGPKWPSWIRQFFAQRASLLFWKLLPFNRLCAFQASSQPSNHVLYQSGQVTFPVFIDEKLACIKVAKSLFQFSVMKRPPWTKVAKQLFWFSLVTVSLEHSGQEAFLIFACDKSSLEHSSQNNSSSDFLLPKIWKPKVTKPSNFSDFSRPGLSQIFKCSYSYYKL